MGAINIRDLIYQQAVLQGVPPDIALGVAQTESGISQWQPNGQVVTSSAGALGVFQLMPATAAGLGVDPTDVNGNIQGGISYLKQLYAKYGDWSKALAAYNWGPGNVDANNSIPGEVAGYVSKVLTAAGRYAAGLFGSSSGAAQQAAPLPVNTDLTFTPGDLAANVSLSPGLVLGVVAVGALALWLWLD